LVGFSRNNAAIIRNNCIPAAGAGFNRSFWARFPMIGVGTGDLAGRVACSCIGNWLEYEANVGSGELAVGLPGE
jgi:hypothetical protein